MRLAFVVLVAACSSPPDPVPFAACMVGPTYQFVDALTLAGTVTASGSGSPTYGPNEFCNPLVRANLQVDQDPADGWFTVSDGTDTTTYGIWGPPSDPFTPPAVGSKVTADHVYDQGEFDPTVAVFELTTPDHELWMATGGLVSDLARAPVPLSRGDAIARSRGRCVTFDYHDLVADGVVVGYGTSAPVAGFDVHHGGVIEQVGSSRCPDAFALQATVAITR